MFPKITNPEATVITEAFGAVKSANAPAQGYPRRNPIPPPLPQLVTDQHSPITSRNVFAATSAARRFRKSDFR